MPIACWKYFAVLVLHVKSRCFALLQVEVLSCFGLSLSLIFNVIWQYQWGTMFRRSDGSTARRHTFMQSLMSQIMHPISYNLCIECNSTSESLLHLASFPSWCTINYNMAGIQSRKVKCVCRHTHTVPDRKWHADAWYLPNILLWKCYMQIPSESDFASPLLNAYT